MHHFQLHLHNQYGNIAKFYLSHDTPVVSINDPLLIETTKNILHAPKRLYAFLEPLIGEEGVLPPEEAIKRRKVFTEALGKASIFEQNYPNILKYTKSLVKKWQTNLKDNQPVPLQKDLTQLSLNLIVNLCFNLSFDNDDSSQITRSFDGLLNEYIIRQYQLPSSIPLSIRDQQCESSLAFLKQTIDHIILERSNNPRLNEKKDFFDLVHDYGRNSTHVRNMLLTAMIGGYHTTGIALSWLIYCLIKNPMVMNKVIDEIRCITSMNEDVQYHQLNQFTYLEQVINETLRLYPPGPYIAREVMSDTSIAGFHIPKNTVLFYPVWAVHMNKHYWLEPEKFDPERFSVEAKKRQHKLAFIPFGIGEKSCSAQKLALFQIKAVTILLLQKFNFTLMDDHPVNLIERFVLRAENDIKVMPILR